MAVPDTRRLIPKIWKDSFPKSGKPGSQSNMLKPTHYRGVERK
jgi:hypothetical protein